MGKTHSKPLAARNGRGTAWTRHAMCESALSVMVHDMLKSSTVLSLLQLHSMYGEEFFIPYRPQLQLTIRFVQLRKHNPAWL